MMPPNMPPPAGGGAPMPGANPAMPPQGAPSDVDQVLLQRFQSLSPQEHDALDAVSPESAAVIMKLVPELGPVIKMILEEQGGSEGDDDDVTTGPEAEQEMGAMENEADPIAPRKPQTALGNY